MFKKLTTAICATLLISCVYDDLNTSPANDPSTFPSSQTSDLSEIEPVALPDNIATLVKEAYAEAQNIPIVQVNIWRFSREIWPDGCLGLGDPVESCLLALTEGWQVEAVDTDTAGSSLFYRLDLTGGQIRTSTLENNLPLSVGDRIFQTIRASGIHIGGELSIVSAEPQLWDSCLGVAADDEVCAAIGILGWRAIVTDTQSIWVYHSDGLGNRIVLKEAQQPLF